MGKGRCVALSALAVVVACRSSNDAKSTGDAAPIAAESTSPSKATATKPTGMRVCRDGAMVEGSMGSGMPYSGPEPKDDSGPFYVTAAIEGGSRPELLSELAGAAADALLCPAIQDVRGCVDAARATSPSLVGSIDAQLSVAASGAISEVKIVGGTLDDPTLAACVRTALRLRTLERSENPWTLEYRIVVAAAHHRSRSVKIIESKIDVPETRRDEVKRAVRARSKDIRRCYEHGLRRLPNLRGTFELSLGIDAAGYARATVKPGTLADPATIACLRSSFESLSFAKGDAANVTYAFELAYDRP